MDTEIQQLQDRVTQLERKLQEHNHNGLNGGLVRFDNIDGSIRTITVATDLTNILASTPRKISEQILIDTTTATKKLYIYDMVGGVWRSATLT